MADWQSHVERETARYRDGDGRLPDDPAERQRQLTRIANAAWGAGLALLMEGRGDEAREWFGRAVDRYRESFADAPAESWGRPIGAMKARILSDDWDGAREAAKWALQADASTSESPIGRYAAALAHTIMERYDDARVHADAIRIRDDFPREVGDALAFIAA